MAAKSALKVVIQIQGIPVPARNSVMKAVKLGGEDVETSTVCARRRWHSERHYMIRRRSVKTTTEILVVARKGSMVNFAKKIV